ncbi:molybdopterin cofactor-binding domain-containing protein [Starkeya sp. ORNL1]|uniref:xanthine dehydrogenase family protein molybdopterin-binding subunit n=1 Tax=Starkeya sp. ORNL1 TaxID=2709380 RepID=UPI001FEF39FC|nr:molybdopterin cofactor-binding domain-containing protein [Starkeya sp. ORNL1]
MNDLAMKGVSRRALLQGAGAVVVSFALAPEAMAQAVQTETQTGGDANAKLPGSLNQAPFLDSWIRIDAKGEATVFTGKAELGQGIRTALAQVAAEELALPMARIEMITADTGLTANEGYTAGSHTLQDSGTAIRNAAAQVREILLAEAARRLGHSPEEMKADNGTAIAPDGTSLTYGDLAAGLDLHVMAAPRSRLTPAEQFRVMGKPVHRLDIPAKVTGTAYYVQDMRPEGLLHARVVRPPSYGATLVSVDSGAVERLPGVVKVVRDGNFLAVVAQREYQAIKAMRALAAAAEWQEVAKLPDAKQLPQTVLGLAAREYTILDKHTAPPLPGPTIEATFTRPYVSHGSIGPSCAVALSDSDMVTVWTHTQGVFPDRKAISEMLGLPPEKVRCIHTPGSGCYGHNGADDAGADAALIATQLPGRPLKVQLMREQEHAWEPYGPAMVTKAEARLDATGKIVDWHYSVWSNTHNMRPGNAGSLLAGQLMSKAFQPPPPAPLPQPEGGGDRNGIPLYVFPNAKVDHFFLPEMPLRVSALRSLGAYFNIFSIESFMDELAIAAHADPVEFRLAHLEDPRGREVIKLAAEKFGWKPGQKALVGRGYGFAFARYKNLAAYSAVAMEVEVERETGQVRLVRAVAAVDTGEIVNPDGVRNQMEGAIIQSASWTLYESVAFDTSRITSVDWSSYPIMRFNAVPESIEVHLIERPGLPFLGAGETGQGPASAALGNAIANAIGVRLRDLPLSPERVKAAAGI